MKIQNLIKPNLDSALTGINKLKNYYLDPIPSTKGKEKLNKTKYGTGNPPIIVDADGSVDGGGDGGE